MTRYAKDTIVSVAKSRAEIEEIVTRYGASAFMSGIRADQALIAFEMKGRNIRFHLPLPGVDQFTHRSVKRGNRTVQERRSENQQREAWEQACRQRWRALALVIKAKLEAVESNISTVEEEFLAHIVLPGGKTVYETTRQQIQIAYESGQVQKLLPDYSERP